MFGFLQSFLFFSYSGRSAALLAFTYARLRPLEVSVPVFPRVVRHLEGLIELPFLPSPLAMAFESLLREFGPSARPWSHAGIPSSSRCSAAGPHLRSFYPRPWLLDSLLFLTPRCFFFSFLSRGRLVHLSEDRFYAGPRWTHAYAFPPVFICLSFYELSSFSPLFFFPLGPRAGAVSRPCFPSARPGLCTLIVFWRRRFPRNRHYDFFPGLSFVPVDPEMLRHCRSVPPPRAFCALLRTQ